MRLVPLLATGFALGIIAADCLQPSRAAALVVLSHAVAAAFALRGRARVACAVAASLASGAAALAPALEQAARSALSAPREAIVEATLAERREGPSGARVVLRQLVAVSPETPLPSAVELACPPSGPCLAGIARGARVRAALRLRPWSAARNPGGSDVRAARARRGLGASATLVHPRLVHAVAPPPCAPCARVEAARERAAGRLVAQGEGGALLAALGLGTRRGLSPATLDALAKLGLVHLISVSGLHVVWVGGLVFAPARWLRARVPRGDARRGALASALAGAAAYAWLSGFEVPAQRSLAFLAAFALAAGLGRPLAPSQILALAALAVLAGDPASLFDVGAELSFLATAALLYARPALPRDAGRLARALHAALSTSAAATALCAPLVALRIGLVSPLGWLANALAVPFTGVLLLPLALVASLAALALPDSRLLQPALAASARVGDAFLAACHALAPHVPAVADPAPSAAALVVASACGVAALRVRALAARCLCAVAGSVALAAWPVGAPPPEPVTLLALDVGQGDALVLQQGERAVLVDAGVAVPDGWDAGERVVRPALAALGVRALDLAIATHADLDHRGGLAAVVESVPVRELWLPRGAGAEPAFAALRALARARGVIVRERGRGDPPFVGGALRVEPLWPPAETSRLSDNDRSLVLRVTSGDVRALLTGDLEATGERVLLALEPDLRADVLKLGHHGSRTSSSAAFLDAVAPRVAIVSAAEFSRFGMPHREVRERLAAREIRWGWTGRDGALAIPLRAPLALAPAAPRGGLCARLRLSRCG